MNSKEKLLQDLTAHYFLDKKSAESVLEYAQSLMSKDRKANDFALAKALNERTTAIFDVFVSSDVRSLDITAINRSYVLLVNALKKIYARNDELSAIERKPIWEYFDILEGLENDIREYTNNWDNDTGQSHNARVNKLCIVTGKEEPDYTPELKKIVNDADTAISDYKKVVEAEIGKKPKKEESDVWQFIPEYKLNYADDGSIIVNDVLKLKKTQSGSAPRKLMEQVVKQPNTLFKPNLGQAYSRRLSSVLSDMGITGTLKSLFFPVVSDSNGIKFRPAISRAIVKSERLDTTELDKKLKELGVDTEIDPSQIPFWP